MHSLFVMVGAVFVFFCLHAQLWNFFGFVAPLSLKTPLKEYSSARARQVRRTVEFSGKLHRISRSRKQRDRCWPRIRHYCAQSETSIRKSSWQLFVKIKITGALSPVLENIPPPFFPTRLMTVVGYPRMFNTVLYYIVLHYYIIVLYSIL